MTAFAIRQFQDSDAASWDHLVANSWNGTFLHTRRFLSYHGDRFKDTSLVIEGENGLLLGVFPAAIDKRNPSRIISHPGITYGGLVHAGEIRGTHMIRVLEAIVDHYKQHNFVTMSYKVVPYIYHKNPSADDLYAFFRINARRYRCDIASVVDLNNRPELNRRRKRSIRKAEASGVHLAEGQDRLREFWPILSELLWSKFRVNPVHSLEEIELLASLFPDQVKCVVASIGDSAIAGVVYFQEDTVLHAQYSAASQKGYELAALDMVFEHCIAVANQRGSRFFSFGICTENEGTILNESLYQFKNEFGAGGIVHEFYEIDMGAK